MDNGDLQKAIAHDGDVDGDLTFDPYNAQNREVRLSDVQSYLKTYGIHEGPFNLELYKRAFVHSSYVRRPQYENDAAGVTILPCPDGLLPLKTKSNERLEFIGDGVLELITKYYLYKRFPKEDEGFMTEKKIALVRNEHIGKLALEMGLHRHLLISRHAEEKKTRTNLKKLGCLFEAFLGALFLDFNRVKVEGASHWQPEVFTTGPGFQIAQVFVESIFEKHVDWVALVTTDNNFKNILQVMVQKGFKTTPVYIEHGFEQEKGYDMGVYLRIGLADHEVDYQSAPDYDEIGSFSAITEVVKSQGRIVVRLGRASHRIKKKAEQAACQGAIERIKLGAQ